MELTDINEVSYCFCYYCCFVTIIVLLLLLFCYYYYFVTIIILLLLLFCKFTVLLKLAVANLVDVRMSTLIKVISVF